MDNLDKTAINRMINLNNRSEYENSVNEEISRIQSVVEEFDQKGQKMSPICYINFGDGKYLTSLIFLDYDKQNPQAEKWIVDLLCKLIVNEFK
jgi:hypothetical protein